MNEMIYNILIQINDVIYRLVVCYIFMLMYESFLGIFSLMNSMLNFNKQKKKLRGPEFDPIIKTDID